MTNNLAPRRTEVGPWQAAWLLPALATLLLLIAVLLVIAIAIATVAAHSPRSDGTLWAPGAPGSTAAPSIRA